MFDATEQKDITSEGLTPIANENSIGIRNLNEVWENTKFQIEIIENKKYSI